MITETASTTLASAQGVNILIWIAVAAFQKIFSVVNVFDYASPLANDCHNQALSLLELSPSRWTWFYEAILIGSDEALRSRSELQSFFTLGLYHLIVVSGSHVLALEKFIQRLLFFTSEKNKKVVVTVALIVFCLVNRLQASCVRAFVSWAISQRKEFRLILQGDLQFIVTCACLILEPKWLNSLSFQLSCGATLGLAIASSLDFENFFAKKFSATFICALVTSPLIFCVQPCLSWLVIPANTFAMPLFEVVLMPLSIINVIFRPLAFFTERILNWVFTISDFFAGFENPLLCLDERRLANWGLIYLLGVYAAWRLFLPLYYRLRFWESQKNPLKLEKKKSFFGT